MSILRMKRQQNSDINIAKSRSALKVKNNNTKDNIVNKIQ